MEADFQWSTAAYKALWGLLPFPCSYIYVTNERQRTISEPRRKNEDTEEAQRRRKQRAKKRKQQMQKKIEENKVPQWCMKSIIT